MWRAGRIYHWDMGIDSQKQVSLDFGPNPGVISTQLMKREIFSEVDKTNAFMSVLTTYVFSFFRHVCFHPLSSHYYPELLSSNGDRAGPRLEGTRSCYLDIPSSTNWM